MAPAVSVSAAAPRVAALPPLSLRERGGEGQRGTGSTLAGAILPETEVKTALACVPRLNVRDEVPLEQQWLASDTAQQA